MSEVSPGAVSSARRCVLAAAVLWSLSGALAKATDLPSSEIAFYRSLFAGLCLLPLVPVAHWRFHRLMVPTCLAFGGMIGLYIAAMRLTTAANAIFLQCTATFWLVPASAILFGERPDRRALLGIGLATIGTLSIVAFGYQGRPGEEWGVLLALGSGPLYAAVVLSLRGLRHLDPTWLSAVNNLGGALALGGWLLLVEGPVPVPGPGQLGFLMVFGVVQMALPYALFARGLRALSAPEAGLIGLLEPVLNPTWVFLVWGERPAPATIVGGGFLLAGILCRYLPSPRRQAPPLATTTPTASADAPCAS